MILVPVSTDAGTALVCSIIYAVGAIRVVVSMLALHTGNWGSNTDGGPNSKRNGVPRQFDLCLKWRSQANKPRREGWLVVWKTKMRHVFNS